MVRLRDDYQTELFDGDLHPLLEEFDFEGGYIQAEPLVEWLIKNSMLNESPAAPEEKDEAQVARFWKAMHRWRGVFGLFMSTTQLAHPMYRKLITGESLQKKTRIEEDPASKKRSKTVPEFSSAYLTTSPVEAIETYCAEVGIQNRKIVDLSRHLDLKTSGTIKCIDLGHFNVDAGLPETVLFARHVQSSTGCQAVMFAWPGGAGVVLRGKTLITSIPYEGYIGISNARTRSDYIDSGNSPEEADKLLKENGDDYEVETRDCLQETWQEIAIRTGKYPTREQLEATSIFSELFSLGFDIKHTTPAQLRAIEDSILQRQNKGPSYTDLGKAKEFLGQFAGESNGDHWDRIRFFFKNAPKPFLGKVSHFTELMPATRGLAIEFASPRVRSSVALGKLATRDHTEWQNGYKHLEEPAKSHKEIVCAALAISSSALTHVPDEIRNDITTFADLFPAKKDRPVMDHEKMQWNLAALEKSLSINRLAEAIAWCVGELRSGSLRSVDLVSLYLFIREHRSNQATRALEA